MQRYSGQALLKFDDVTTGNTTGVVGVTVRDHETQDLAVLYSDNGITGKSNPFNTDSDGKFSFYAANGVYDVIIEQGTAQESRQDDVILFDPRDGFGSAMTAADFFALAEKRRRDAAGSGEEHGVPFSAYIFPALNPDNFELAQFAKIVDGVRVSSDATSSVLLAPAPDGLDKADGTGRFADLAAAIAAGGTELSASVINRQDYCFLEVWHEKVSDKDIVVPLGNAQYGATDWNGISLVGLDTLGVAQGYSAFGEWDTTTQGNGVQWSTLSDADKSKFVADPENNIYLSEGGELIQVRYRIRVVAGLEGDWIREGAHYISTGGQYVAEQGDSDVSAGLIGLRAFNAVDADKGILQSASGYQVPICMVSRHNSGVKEPAYNSRGADRLTGDQFWHQNPTAISSVADCFDPAKKAGKGDIASGVSGRDDAEFYDAIYAKYVQDLRKSSLVRPVDEIREEYKRKAIAAQPNFTPTMWEKVPFIQVFERTVTGRNVNLVSFSSIGAEYSGTECYMYNPNVAEGQIIPVDIKDGTGGNQSGTSHYEGATPSFDSVNTSKREGDYFNGVRDGYSAWNSGDTIYIISMLALEQRAAEHTWTDIVGDPARIAATFPDGVAGQWIPEIPAGGSNPYTLNRKDTGDLIALRTSDDGVTWQSISYTVNNANNTWAISVGATQVALFYYSTPAHFTEDRVNAEVLSLGSVAAFNDHNITRGNLLTSCIIDRVLTEKTRARYGFTAKNYPFVGESLTVKVEHDTVTTDFDGTQGAEKIASKALDYLAETNGVLGLQYAYKEMIYDVTWGDNNQFEITDNESTLTDDNGNTVLYGTAGFETAYFYLDKSAS